MPAPKSPEWKENFKVSYARICDRVEQNLPAPVLVTYSAFKVDEQGFCHDNLDEIAVDGECVFTA